MLKLLDPPKRVAFDVLGEPELVLLARSPLHDLGPHLLLVAPVHWSIVVVGPAGNGLSGSTRASNVLGFDDKGFGACGFALLLLGHADMDELLAPSCPAAPVNEGARVLASENGLSDRNRPRL